MVAILDIIIVEDAAVNQAVDGAFFFSIQFYSLLGRCPMSRWMVLSSCFECILWSDAMGNTREAQRRPDDTDNG